MKTIRLIMRGDRKSSRHHMWPNNGTWFCHCCIGFAEGNTEKVERFRFSLHTANELEAVQRRDFAISELAQLLKYTSSLEAPNETSSEFLVTLRTHLANLIDGRREPINGSDFPSATRDPHNDHKLAPMRMHPTSTGRKMR